MISLNKYITPIKATCLLAFFICMAQFGMAQISNRKLEKLINSSPVLSEHFTGIFIGRIDQAKPMATYHADKYFTPASNTKLFTFYTSLMMLDDSIPALEYEIAGDTLFFRGTGDPSFMHPEFKNKKVWEFLKNTPQQYLVYCERPFESEHFGPGWSWDDYNYYYQADRSVFPFHNNLVFFTSNGHSGLKVSPKMFETSLFGGSGLANKRFRVYRAYDANKFHYPMLQIPKNYHQEVPFRYSTRLFLHFLEDTLKRNVLLGKHHFGNSPSKVHSLPADTVLKRMMEISDNFIAEQMLLVCSSTLGDTLCSERLIEYSEQHFLSDLPDSISWVDGSGLSRYNLFTPHSIATLLKKIYKKVPQKRLFNMLATGGKSGTLKNYFKADEPYVFAKTGTLSNQHNLSGYLISESGKVYVFSFMNNNYMSSTGEVRRAMEDALKKIRKQLK